MSPKNACGVRIPGTRAMIAVVLAIIVLSTSAPAGDEERIVSLGETVTAEITAAAQVVISTTDGLRLLTIQPPELSSRQRRARSAPTTFLLNASEGDEGGHRGFSRRADDDGDGAVDEDRADGIDNDGDGAVDEDFAAIGDRMSVVHTSQGGRNLHLESYHWNYEHLQRILVLSWDAVGLEHDELLLRLDGVAWSVTGIGWSNLRHPDTALMNRTMAVAKLSGTAGEYWLGISVLTTGNDDPILLIEDKEMRLGIGGGCDLAVCVAPTLSQLRCRMVTAHRLAAGARGTAPGQVVPWIVPPPREIDPDLRLEAMPHLGLDGTVALEIAVPAASQLLLDPETFRCDGRLLGAPTHVQWRTETAGTREGSWSELWPDPQSWRTAAQAPHPYLKHREQIVHDGASIWTFVFDRGEQVLAAERITVEVLCGHALAVDLAVDPFLVNVPEEQESPDERRDKTRPTLAPHLLDGYPNPFVDHLRIRFTVPEKISDGFDPADQQEMLLKADDPIPYSLLPPRTKVTIYTVSGQVVMTLFDEICDFGSHQTSWNCLDTQGRPVATGTYFCKLQIENWSVTKRVVLLR